MTQAECSQCRAPLADVRFVEQVECSFCHRTQPNPRRLIGGQEVLALPFGGGYQLLQVVSYDGPANVNLEADGEPKTVHIDTIIPVERPVKLERGLRVYANETGRWELTEISSVSGSIATVKHGHAEFKDAFFDRKVAVTALRVRADGPVEIVAVPKGKSLFSGWMFWAAVFVFLGLPALRVIIQIIVELFDR